MNLTQAGKEAPRQKALELIRGSVKVLRGNRLKVDSLVRWGNPAEEILKETEKSGAPLVVMRGGAAECILAAAKEYNPDIIALGSRGLSGIESLLLGSVAERVARYASGSVLIVRASGRAGEKNNPAKPVKIT